jgi:transcription elongation GreA/GreB family factor
MNWKRNMHNLTTEKRLEISINNLKRERKNKEISEKAAKLEIDKIEREIEFEIEFLNAKKRASQIIDSAKKFNVILTNQNKV